MPSVSGSPLAAGGRNQSREVAQNRMQYIHDPDPPDEGPLGLIMSLFGGVRLCGPCSTDVQDYERGQVATRPIDYRELTHPTDEEDPLLQTQPSGAKRGSQSGGGGCCRCCCGWAGRCCCLLLLLPLIAWAALVFELSFKSVSRYVSVDDRQARQFAAAQLQMRNITANIDWPGCGRVKDADDFTERCTKPCYSPEIPRAMNAYNRKHPGELVSYVSRDHRHVESIMLSGWWLPVGELVQFTTTATTTSTVTSTTVTETTTTTREKRHAHAAGSAEEPSTTAAAAKADGGDDKAAADDVKPRLLKNHDKREPRPRIVVQHGFSEDSDNLVPMLAAYMLRDLGFDVLVNNFRDYGYSKGSNEHVLQWGDAYPYDILGAWDFLRKDPLGIMGGELPSSKVGVVAFGSGAFAALDAFGRDGEVPAIWVDSPPFEPVQLMKDTLESDFEELQLFGNRLPKALKRFVLPVALRAVEVYAKHKGVDLTAHLPSTELKKGPDTGRPVYVVANKDDAVVPIIQRDALMELLASMPQKYVVQGSFENEGVCNGRSHTMNHLSAYDEYKVRLCKFWKTTFGLDDTHCLEP